MFDSTGKRRSGKIERVFRIRVFEKHSRLNGGTGLPFHAVTRFTLKWMVALICLLILCSCGAKLPFVKDDDAACPQIKLRNPPKSIAILPFGNQTDEADLEKFVRTTVYSHLTPHPYKDMELHEVDHKLRRHNLMNYDMLSKVSPKRLGRILGCDAVVLGEVTEFQRVYAGLYSQLAVGATITIWDTRSGKKLWSDEHVTRHHEGGIPLAITDLAMISIRSGLNLRDSEKVKTVDELSRHLISRVPVPDTGINGKKRITRDISGGSRSRRQRGRGGPSAGSISSWHSAASAW